MPSFDKLRHRSNDQDVLLIAFDLLELDGNDLRREPFEVRKQTLASLLRGSLPGLQFNAHLSHAATSCSSTLARWVSKASCEAARLALSLGANARLAEVQKSGGAGGADAKRRRTGERGGVHEERPRRRSCCGDNQIRLLDACPAPVPS